MTQCTLRNSFKVAPACIALLYNVCQISNLAWEFVVQKWQEVLRGTNPALKKKAVVAIGRQLMVDLWRLQTGRVTAQELNLVMISD
jgi:hypothetical protein